MAENKTKPTDIDPVDYIATIEHEVRRQDAETLFKLLKRVSRLKPKMWGANLIGFGKYKYKYESGREGEMFRTGFSAQKTKLSVYIIPGFDEYGELMGRLGKHKVGKSCLYINKLSDVDLEVLEALVRASLAKMKERYG